LGYSTGFASERAINSFYTPLEFVVARTSTTGLFDAYWKWWYRLCEPEGGYNYEGAP